MPTTPTKPEKQCDLIMKGAIASGVVYTPAVLALKDEYSFRCIGGTSSGAIAAAATAAAEFGRDIPGSGFDKLKELKNYLSNDDNHLRNLFQATPDMQPLLDVLDPLLVALQPGSKQSDVTATKTKENTPRSFQFFLQLLNKLPLPQPVLQFARTLLPIWKQTNPAFQKGKTLGMWVGICGGIVLVSFLVMILLAIDLFVVPEGEGKLWVGVIALLLLAIAAVFFGWLGRWIGCIISAVNNVVTLITKKLPDKEHFYGICNGHSKKPSNENPNLTDWLYTSFNELAGLKADGPPLTFGHLRGTRDREGEEIQNPDEKMALTLRMITTNLSHSQPYLLPDGLEGFLFKKDEMCQLFPKQVVAQMTDDQHRRKDIVLQGISISEDSLPEGFCFLPKVDNLPVVFATRLSLSFPLLISAIPLYTFSNEALVQLKKPTSGSQPKLTQANNDVLQNWFSDGGICSNFPIQFFDAWLPKLPTFGINLAQLRVPTKFSALQMPPEFEEVAKIAESIDSLAQSSSDKTKMGDKNLRKKPLDEPVYLPKADDPLSVEWEELSGLGKFLQTIFLTGLGYRDTMQSSLPSYRERVVQIRLSEDEAGLNLRMSPTTIQSIVDKGKEAGEKLLPATKAGEKLLPATKDGEFNFEQHQWARFLVLIALLEQNLLAVEDILKDTPSWLTAQLSAQPKFPYDRDANWCEVAKQRVELLQALIKCWGTVDITIQVKVLQSLIQDWQNASPTSTLSGTFLLGNDAPLPKPVLRITPDI
jgi:predicted acylesterase/phospholipase RssA